MRAIDAPRMPLLEIAARAWEVLTRRIDNFLFGCALMLVGASGFVVKDSGAATIATAIATVCAGHEYVDPQLGGDDALPLAA